MVGDVAMTLTGSWPSSGVRGSGHDARREGGGVGAVLRVRDQPLSGRHPRAERLSWSSSRSTSSTASRARRWARCGCRRRRRRSTSCSPGGAPRCHEARKYLPAARDYFAASLWRRLGLRINETVMLDIRDWRPDLGEFGKLHVRHGKGSRGRGPKQRLVPAINGADVLIDWWLAEVRHQFGDDWSRPGRADAAQRTSRHRLRPLPPGRHQRVASRTGDADRAVAARLVGAADAARAAPLLRLVAVRRRDGPQGPAGAVGPSVAVDHVGVHPRPRDHIEQAWTAANRRLESRFE